MSRQAEKEVLDAEMDLYQKQQAGVDTSQLQRRVMELKQQLNTLASRGGRGRGRPATVRGRSVIWRRTEIALCRPHSMAHCGALMWSMITLNV